MALPGLATDCLLVARPTGVASTEYAVEFMFGGILYRTRWTRTEGEARGWKRTLETFGWSTAASGVPIRRPGKAAADEAGKPPQKAAKPKKGTRRG